MRVAVAPTCTVPKSSESGDTSMSWSATGGIPVPLSETETFGSSGSSLATSSVPLAAPLLEDV